jgi:hypothetical protein
MRYDDYLQGKPFVLVLFLLSRRFRFAGLANRRQSFEGAGSVRRTRAKEISDARR